MCQVFLLPQCKRQNVSGLHTFSKGRGRGGFTPVNPTVGDLEYSDESARLSRWLQFILFLDGNQLSSFLLFRSAESDL